MVFKMKKSLAIAFIALIFVVSIAFAFSGESANYNIVAAIGDSGGNGSSANYDMMFITLQQPVGYYSDGSVIHAGPYCTFNTPPAITSAGITPAIGNTTTTITVYAVVNDADNDMVQMRAFSDASGSNLLCTSSTVSNGSVSCSFAANSAGCSEGTCYVYLYAREMTLNMCNGYDFSPTYRAVSFIYDITAPAIPHIYPNTTYLGYKYKGGNLTVNFTYIEANPANYTIDIFNSTATICTKTNASMASGTVFVSDFCTISSSANDGYYTIIITIYDTVGQYFSNEQTDAVQIDSVNPAGTFNMTPTLTVSGTKYGKGTISLDAAGADNVNGSGMWKVEFYYNQTLIDTDYTPPYGIIWNTANVPDGRYNITARVYDKAGNYIVAV